MDVRDLSSLGAPQALIDVWQEKVEALTEIQVRAVEAGALDGSTNLLVVAPTTSGKTFVGEVAATASAYSRRRHSIFLVPFRALAEEHYELFRARYGELLSVVISTSDYAENDADVRAGNFNLAVMTYEKLMGFLVQAPDLLARCTTLVVDEVQTLGEGERGARLEMLLTQVLLAPERPQLIALSASLDEIGGLDIWLQARLVISAERPVPLTETVCDSSGRATFLKGDELMQRQLVSAQPEREELLLALVEKLVSRGRQVIVFRSTVRSVHDTPPMPRTDSVHRFHSDDEVRSFAAAQLKPELEPPPPVPQVDIIDQLVAALTRGSFRRTKIDGESAVDVRRKVAARVQDNSPISLTIPFGGYKNHRARSFPEPDWAELFNMNYMARYLFPVTARYAPGVIAYYTYSSRVMDVVSNIPIEATDSYMDRFHQLLSVVNQDLPDNLRLTTFDITQQYDRPELLKELRTNFEDNQERWQAKFSADERAKRVASAQRNLIPRGVQDFSNLDDDAWASRCEEAAMWCEALDSLERRRLFNKYSEHIQLVFVRGPSLSIHVGSCDTAAHHFWSGTGVVHDRQRDLLQGIMSEPKIESQASAGYVHDVAVETPLLEISESFSAVPVIAGST